MHPLVYVMLLGGVCAHYRSYDDRNLIVREEPIDNLETGENVVECPVCTHKDPYLPNDEQCPIERAGKRYKRCMWGTYINDKCGNRIDCLRGPNEACMGSSDPYGRQCTSGYRCSEQEKKCIGLYSPSNTRLVLFLNPLRNMFE